MSNAIIDREYQGRTFRFREDGYFNMTQAAAHFGKKLSHFWENLTTVEYMEAAKGALKSPAGGEYPLVETKRGRTGGTWAHPKLAVFFARWLDPKFSFFCDMVIDDILSKKAELTITQPEQSMAMKVPQSFPEALRLAAELAEQNEKLSAANKVMHEELNSVTLDEYRALTHRYFSHGYKVRLGKAASAEMRSRGLVVEKQPREITIRGERQEVFVNVYPRAVLEEVEAQLA